MNPKVLYPDEPFRRPSFRHLPHPSPPDRQSQAGSMKPGPPLTRPPYTVHPTLMCTLEL
ncbi:uncharacterized protein LY79DRAFT_546558, partial [Colletotrichum navitas]